MNEERCNKYTPPGVTCGEPPGHEGDCITDEVEFECKECAGTGRYGFRDDDDCPCCHGSRYASYRRVKEYLEERKTGHDDPNRREQGRVAVPVSTGPGVRQEREPSMGEGMRRVWGHKA